jgi:hypothetical protein
MDGNQSRPVSRELVALVSAKMRKSGCAEGFVAFVALVPSPNCPEFNSIVMKDCLAFGAKKFISFLEGVVARYFTTLQMLVKKTVCNIEAQASRAQIAGTQLM